MEAGAIGETVEEKIEDFLADFQASETRLATGEALTKPCTEHPWKHTRIFAPPLPQLSTF